MRKIYLVTLIVLVGLVSADQLTVLDFYNFVDNNTALYNSTDNIKPLGFQESIIVFTVYNSTDQMSAIYYQDMILYSDDIYIVEKIKNLEAATVWG